MVEGSKEPAGGATTASRSHVEDWFDVLVDHGPAAMGVICAVENRCIRANQALARLYGLSLEQILNTDPFSLSVQVTHPEDLPREQALFGELAAGERTSYAIEKRFVRPDGSWRWAELTLSGIYERAEDGASPYLRFVVFHIVDISEQKALAQAVTRREDELRQMQRVDTLGHLSVSIAHDFGNLLTAIGGHGELLRRALQSPKALALDTLSEHVDAVLEACAQATGLTRQLLSYGRRGPQVPRVLVVSDAVDTICRMLRCMLGRDVTLEAHLEAQAMVKVDEALLGQIVMNLVLNARDAVDGGGVILVLTRDVESEGSGRSVELTVSDTGHGMDEETRARIFEPFFTTREDRPGTRGTGLGLSTVQRIVEEAGGTIDVKTAPGKGTTVTVGLPAVEAERAEADDDAQLGPIVEAGRYNLLIVESDPAVRSLLGTLLLGAGYRVTVARNESEARDFAGDADLAFDLLVTELAMPGAEPSRLVAAVQSELGQTRVLFVSGYGDPGAEALGPRASLVCKPFTRAQLLSAVSAALKR